jgi:hypothetical protein
MLKIGLTAAVTAACCFAIAAATGFGAPPVLNLTLRGIITLKSDNFHCQALTTTQVACGANALGNSTQVYFSPHALAVVKFDKTGTKGTIVFNAKR